MKLLLLLRLVWISYKGIGWAWDRFTISHQIVYIPTITQFGDARMITQLCIVESCNLKFLFTGGIRRQNASWNYDKCLLQHLELYKIQLLKKGQIPVSNAIHSFSGVMIWYGSILTATTGCYLLTVIQLDIFVCTWNYRYISKSCDTRSHPM